LVDFYHLVDLADILETTDSMKHDIASKYAVKIDSLLANF